MTMNYIYDILVNMKENLYDFYDWDKNDDISHLRKIPLFRVDNKTYNDLINCKVKVSKDFLTKIFNKTEEFKNKKINFIKYESLFSNGLDSICIKFNDDGISNSKSKLIINENEEVLEVSEKIEEEKIKYSVIKKEQNSELRTRNDIKIEKYINKELNTNNIEKLKYLFYECFNEKEENREIIIKKINKSLINNWDYMSSKIYDFFKLSSVKK